MRKFILLFIASIICSFTSYAQQEQKIGTDGFYIGMSKLDMLGELGKMGGFKLDEKFEAENAYNLSYTKVYKNNDQLGYTFSIEDAFDTVFCIYKYYVTFNRSFIEDVYNKKLADMIYAYGQPIIAGKTSSTWRLKGYIISLKWSGETFNGIVTYAIEESYQQVFN